MPTTRTRCRRRPTRPRSRRTSPRARCTRRKGPRSGARLTRGSCGPSTSSIRSRRPATTTPDNRAPSRRRGPAPLVVSQPLGRLLVKMPDPAFSPGTQAPLANWPSQARPGQSSLRKTGPKLAVPALSGQGHARLGGGGQARERLGEVQLDAGRVVRQVADGQVLAKAQLVVAAACGRQERAIDGGCPDDVAVDDVVEVLPDR